MLNRRRVVVTGLGMLTPVGNNVQDTWSNILAGKSGISTIEHFDPEHFTTKICGKIKNFDTEAYFSAKEARRTDLFTQFGVAAAQEAIEDAKLDVLKSDPNRIGVAVGSGIGGISTITNNYKNLLEHGPRRVSPFFIPAGIINMVAGIISIRFGLKGPNISVVTACTTGTHNIGHAARIIAYGDADVMLAGGAEMATTDLCVAGFSACRALSSRNEDPEKASRPWDKDRDGFVLGEGAGVLVLEEYEHAKQRGAHIYAECLGFGMSADAYHITGPEETGEGFSRSMQNALNDAQLSPERIDYVNAHGTSTPLGDYVEALALKRTFGQYAPELAISSTKSMVGHLIAAAGSTEAIFSILAIRDNVAPPTINLDNPGEGCDLNFVPHKAQSRKIDISLSNSFGFGGTNGTLIFSRYE